MTTHQSEAERQPLADLEAASRLCLASLAGLSAEAEASASQAHSLLLGAILEERTPYVTVRLRAADARVAALQLSSGESPAGEAVSRAAGALSEAGWRGRGPGRLTGGEPPSLEALQEEEQEAVDRLLAGDRDRASSGRRPASESFEMLASERQALARLAYADSPAGSGAEESELADDYVMTVQEVVGHAVEALASRLEELAGSLLEELPAPVSYDGWRRVAAAALADDLEPALGGLPLGEAGEGEAK